MLVIFGILIITTAVILGLIVLIQNPKGGGISGTLGGFSNQLMGVKQTTDVMEKGTWIFAAIFGVLCLVSSAFIPKNGRTVRSIDPAIPATQKAQQPAAPAAQPNTVPLTPTAPPAKQP